MFDSTVAAPNAFGVAVFFERFATVSDRRYNFSLRGRNVKMIGKPG